MKLRKLELKDAPLMLEWMHEPSVVENMKTDFTSKSIEDCESFIKAAQNCVFDLNLAIADDEDIYMGTVSLKHIKNGTAEFAIAVRKVAMGQGYSKFGMAMIIKIGFEKLGLKKIYWCVSSENKRAIRFYDKNGYKRVETDTIEDILCGGGQSSGNRILYMVSANRNLRREKELLIVFGGRKQLNIENLFLQRNAGHEI